MTHESSIEPSLHLASVLELLRSAFTASTFGIALYRDHDGVVLFANDAIRGRLDPKAPVDATFIARHQTDRLVRFAAGEETYAVVVSDDRTRPGDDREDLARRAYYDELTGLPKTQLLNAAVDSMIEEDVGAFAVAFIDLDNFKFVNDCYGHAVGDRLLVKVSDRLAETIRNTDILARVGGDEFVVVLFPMAPDEAIRAVQRLSARIREPFSIDGFEIFASVSIGMSLYPVDGDDYETLRAKADMAMYACKANGKGDVRVFDVAMSRAATRRMEGEQRLRLAMRDGRIACAYQRKVDFRSDAIIGAEVLLRWRDEDGAIHPPGDFIRLAIELGLLDELTMTILGRVVEEIGLIDRAFGPSCAISLNVDATQAANAGFMARLAAAIRAADLADRIMLELTEEALLAAEAFKVSVLPMLRAEGIKISIDDFGAGYSSLATLAELAADELKIDRCFIVDIHKKPRNQAIVKVIDSLAATLGMRVVVEGVESYEELAYLLSSTRIACGQGYYFGKPITLHEAGGANALTPLQRSPHSRDHRVGHTRSMA